MLDPAPQPPLATNEPRTRGSALRGSTESVRTSGRATGRPGWASRRPGCARHGRSAAGSQLQPPAGWGATTGRLGVPPGPCR